MAEKNPYAGIPILATDAYANDPKRKKADYTYFRQPFDQTIDRLHELGTPFPNSPNWDPGDTEAPYGPGWEQLLGFIANTGAAAGAGIGKVGVAAAGGILNPLNDMGEWLTYGNEQQPTKPQAKSVPQSSAPAAPPNELAGIPFDQSYDIPGSGILQPAMPKMSVPGYEPDYAATDARLAAAKPQLKMRPEGEQLTLGGAEGLAQASGQHNSGGWGQQLAQQISGFAQGMSASRRQMDEQALQHEQKMEEYNLKLAGVEATRAEAQARAKVDQARVHNEMATNEWKMAMANWESQQPTVQMLGDGSVVSIQRGPDGNTTVQRMGQEDQFKIAQAVTAAKATGVAGKAATNSRILRQFGPAGAQLAAITEMASIPGVLRSLIAPDQLENFENELQEKMMQAQGLSGTAQAEMVKNIENSLYIKYIIGDPFSRQRLQQFYGQ